MTGSKSPFNGSNLFLHLIFNLLKGNDSEEDQVSSKKDKERFSQRQLQIDLAEERGHVHMGANAKQDKI